MADRLKLMLRSIFLFFFLSGFSALIFEVLWVRQLALILGNTAQATSTVLAVFLGGLALGAFLAGKYLQRISGRPLYFYGILEISVGVVALVVSQMLPAVTSVYVALFHLLPAGNFALLAVRLLLSTALLLLPTVLMGATLPTLVAYLDQYKQSARLFSLLYGLNTLGAAAGSLSACFLGFPYIGLHATLLCAAAINITIGGFAAVIGWRSPSFPAEAAGPRQQDDAALPAPEAKPSGKLSMPVLWAISFCTGFTALSYEVLWTRILRYYLTSITYAFTIMVSTFLLGLAIGSLIYETYVQKKGASETRPLFKFGCIQYLAAAMCSASLIIFPLTINASMKLLDLAKFHSFTLLDFSYMFLLSVPTILVPSIFIGILFPMIGTLAVSRLDRADTAIGTIYALNTIGCVCGSLASGLLLIPSIGSIAAFQWTVCLSALTGAFCIFFVDELSLPRRLALICLPVMLAICYPTLRFDIYRQPGQIILARGEDSIGVIQVIAPPQLDGLVLMWNGSPLASTNAFNRRYMRLLGHLPMLIHKQPQKVMVACFGTGTTAGAVSLYPDLKQEDIVELSKMVLNAAPLFRNSNYDVLQQKNVVACVNDARNFLLTTNNKYDVITSEPPPPTEAGVVNLYTEEYYRLAHNHLNKDGILCQWIPMNQVPRQLWKMMIVSARRVFPYVSIWMPNTKQAIFLASMQPINVDFAKMQARIDSSEKIKNSLEDVGYDNALAVAATYVVSGAALDQYLEGTLAITDDYPSLEFFLPFAGRSENELSIESVGYEQVKQLAASNAGVKGFDAAQFRNHWQGIHLLRQVANDLRIPRRQADQLIDQALMLFPRNKWFQHISFYRADAYPCADLGFSN